MKTRQLLLMAGLATNFFASPTQATVVLYDQNFENPNSPPGFINSGIDVSQQTVNSLYGSQPAGFTFAQTFTVETLLITGNLAFGHGYSDPSGKGGRYAIGMLSSAQDDLLGLSFNIGSNTFLNVRLDISSIDLSGMGGPFSSTAPTFEFTLYDNPSGAISVGSGTILDSLQASGTASAQDVFAWTEVLLPLDASGNTNGNVTLQIDLLTGGYAAMDNFRIAASNTAGDVGGGSVPEPATLALVAMGLAGLGYSRACKPR